MSGGVLVICGGMGSEARDVSSSLCFVCSRDIK